MNTIGYNDALNQFQMKLNHFLKPLNLFVISFALTAIALNQNLNRAEIIKDYRVLRQYSDSNLRADHISF